ncbi:hypothetical protein QBC40DRAFT_229275 [Triangularia verruculosa]|uniref:Uncharacterized protein n=1 Tax=Triangularia verruculosa TaxID=2587418 RepID=A0AAN7AVD1_9PEZI|nr:hypothetical protein QBC40DRAFT_229275 [Triangularia verruculosa]
MSQTSHPTLINLPQPPSNPETPEIPGTPTSTTTSLSALSTTAIKDGHKGTVHHHPSYRGPPQYDPSNSSLEAERADRISRLTGLAPAAYSRQQQQLRGQSAQPFSQTQTQQFQPPTGIAYFDAQGQPQMQNKMSTVGSASATEASASIGAGSVSGMSRTTTMRGRGEDGDDDMLTEMDSASVAGASHYTNMGPDDDMMMDDDSISRRSAGTYDEEDDGRESLVGFGEGAGSTVSGPIYHRRGMPSTGGVGQQGLERSNSGFSEAAPASNHLGMTARNNNTSSGAGIVRPFSNPRLSDNNNNNNNSNNNGSNSDTPISQTAAGEIERARMVDGVAFEGTVAAAQGATVPGSVGDDVFVDTTTGGPVPMQQPMAHPTSAIRETQQPGSHQHVAQQQALAFAQQQHQQRSNVGITSPSALSVGSGSTGTGANSREAAERIIREQFGGGDGPGRGTGGPLGSPRGDGQRLGRFYFEER